MLLVRGTLTVALACPWFCLLWFLGFGNSIMQRRIHRAHVPSTLSTTGHGKPPKAWLMGFWRLSGLLGEKPWPMLDLILPLDSSLWEKKNCLAVWSVSLITDIWANTLQNLNPSYVEERPCITLEFLMFQNKCEFKRNNFTLPIRHSH